MKRDIITVFPPHNSNTCYRIPTIIRTHTGALLAFAEKREYHGSDLVHPCEDNGVNDIVMKKKH